MRRRGAGRGRSGSLAPLGGVQRNVDVHTAALRAVRKRSGSRILPARVPFRPVCRWAAALLFAMSEQGGKKPFFLFPSAGQPSHLTFPIPRSHPRKRRNTTPAVGKTRGCAEQVAHRVRFLSVSRTPAAVVFSEPSPGFCVPGRAKAFRAAAVGKTRTVFVSSPCLARPRLSCFRSLRPASVFQAGQKLFARLRWASRAPCSFSLRVSHARGFHFFGAFARLLCSGQGKSFSRGCGEQDAHRVRFLSASRTPAAVVFSGPSPGSCVPGGAKAFCAAAPSKSRTVFVFSPRLARPRLSFFRGLRPAPVFRAGQKLFARLRRASRTRASASLCS